MCFSASASFGTAILLVPAGVYCLWNAARKDPRYLPLAMTPLAFAIQQVCEGAVWVEFSHGTRIVPGVAEIAYLFFALAFWPFWLPFSVAWFDRKHRLLDGLLAAAGLGIGLSLYVPILTGADRFLAARVSHHSIRYDLEVIPALSAIPVFASRTLYLATVSMPLLLCAHRGLRLFGCTILIAGIMSQLVLQYAYISVWCMFAAIMSCYLCVCFRDLPVCGPPQDAKS